MKRALIITWEKFQDHELIYPYHSLKENNYWIYNPHHYEINFSPFHINEFTVEKYVEKLNVIIIALETTGNIGILKNID